MTSAQALVITKYVEGVFVNRYKQMAEDFIADRVMAPYVADTMSGMILESDDSELYVTDPRRAQGASAGTVESGVAQGNTFNVTDEVLREPVTWEQLQQEATEFGLNAYNRAANALAGRFLRWKEAHAASLFRSINPVTRAYSTALGIYNSYTNQVTTLLDGSHWDQTGGDPLDDIYVLRKWLEENTFYTPNTLIIPEHVALAVRENANVVSEFGNSDDLFNKNVPEQLRGLNIIRPRAKAKFEDGATSIIWGDDVWLGHIDLATPWQSHAVDVRWSLGGDMSMAVTQDPDESRKVNYVKIANGYHDRVTAQSGGSTMGALIRDTIARNG